MSREEQFSSYSQYDSFERRHIGPTSIQEDEMLKSLGYKDMKSFISDVVPSNIAMSKKLSDVLPHALNEIQVIEELRKMANKNLVFEIEANRFLRNMVRAIVGTMIDVGKEKISIEDFIKIIESKKRSNAGASVPGKGLFLTKVVYK